MHLWENDYGGFLGKGVGFGLRLYLVFMGHIQMDGMPIWWLALESYSSSFPFVFSTYSSCGGEW